MSEARSGRRPLIILLVLAAVAVLCCGGGLLAVRVGGLCVPFADCGRDPASLFVRNERPTGVRVHVETPNGPFDYPQAAGTDHSYGDTVACQATRVVAYDDSGSAIATIDGVGCVTKTWILGADGSARLLAGRVAG
ncbi:hypothetical protein [Hamadaea tsunoensis]|uniref:hypothetical protein n=1 Tax=Hamadaea tsunoensis TaxID=53368 RepID=UPI00040D1F32|nr:hypothetical protein [Hamadaea tsunoensis]